MLGTALALQDVTQQEVPSRIAAGWRAFWAQKDLLLNRLALVKSRMHLFDATVESGALWCSQSWSLRGVETHLLSTARRAMLRRIAGSGRASDEDYLDWIQRVTRKAEQLAHNAGVNNWAETH